VVDLAGLEMGPFANGGTGGLPPLFVTWNNIPILEYFERGLEYIPEKRAVHKA
jgi:hypothetical protein